MYCSSCGANAAPNLTYCKSCGAHLRGETQAERKAFEISPTILVAAIVTTFIFGMAALVSLLAAAKRLDLNEPQRLPSVPHKTPTNKKQRKPIPKKSLPQVKEFERESCVT